MPVTLKDIAEQTGVSPSVVSTVLSGRENGTFVSEVTRRKVLQVAEMLHYTPVRSGRPRGSRRLRRQREERFIGVWDPQYSANTAFYVHNLQTALRHYVEEVGAAAEDDYGLRLLGAEDLPRLDALGIMGLVLLSPILLPREAAAATLPCVMLGEVDHPPRGMIQVHPDEQGAGVLLAQHLWSLGHRRICFLVPNMRSRVARHRLAGLQAAWKDAGGDVADVRPVEHELYKALPGREQVRRAVFGLFGAAAPAETQPSALACDSEHVAALATQALAEIGRPVPRSVSLAAFNDTPQMAEAMTPPLTVVRFPVAQITAEAISQLFESHNAPDAEPLEARDIALPGELVIRSSCTRLWVRESVADASP